MYLSGSKWNMRKRRRRTNPWRVLFLAALVGGAVYVERVIVPTVPPLFVPTLTPTRSPASFVLEAESLFQAGKLDQAASAYLQAVEVDPGEEAYYIQLARIQMYQGQYPEAETSARNALLINSNSAQARAYLAWALDFEGNLADAREEIESALATDPNSAVAYAFYAEILMDESVGNYEEALRAAQTAVQLDPNIVESHRALGYVWELTSSYDQALDSYQRALRINPNLAMLHISMGNMYLSQNDSEAAIQSYLRASSLSPTDTTPYTLIALTYGREGEFGKARQNAKVAVDLQPANPFLRGDLGKWYYKNNELDPAIQELALAIHGGASPEGVSVEGLPLDPASGRVVEFYYTYGLALAKVGNCGLAIDIFEALLRGVPDDEIAVFNATEGLRLCGEGEGTPTPEGSLTPTP